jgi:hypothetical protein
MPKKYESSKRRLRAIEGTQGAFNVRLLFPDGSTRAAVVAKEHRLRLLIDAFDRIRAFPPPGPELSQEIIPEPVTSSDNLLRLMEPASSVEGDRLIQTVFGICKTISQHRHQKGETNE